MSIEIILEHEVTESAQPSEKSEKVDPDEYFSKNAFRIVYQTSNFFLPQLKDLVDKGDVLNIRPEYQRRLRWTRNQKSKLIESLLLNIPIPPIFLYETHAARYEVMDGQQRLNAIHDYLTGGFALTGLEVLDPLNGLVYTKCPPRIKRALDRANISAIVLLLESDKDKIGASNKTDIRRFIFDRLNTGGTKLNPQEIRNALNPGLFNDMIISITREPIFTTVFDIPIYKESDPNDYYENQERQKNRLYATMGDCQLALRFFALRDPKNIRGSMKAILDRAMQAEIDTSQAETLRHEFIERITFLNELFDSKPFRLLPNKEGTERLSASLYDSFMVALDALWDKKDTLGKDKTNINQRLSSALRDPDKSAVLTGQGNTAQAIRDRIDMVRNKILAV